MYPLALHVFRRDLRLLDNTALIEALKRAQTVIPCFIFDKRQIENNDYKSDASLQFMAHSLQELDIELKKKGSKLYLFYGIAEEIIARLLSEYKIKAVFTNRDYTPFSLERDQKIKKLCTNAQVDFYSYADTLLHEPEEVMKRNQTPYTTFTPFFKQCLSLSVHAPKKNSYHNYYQQPISFEDKAVLETLLKLNNPDILLTGGRKEALFLLKKLQQLSDYGTVRNFPALNGTTQLSAHNKFGTLSIRECYLEVVKNFGAGHELIKELYWRDFFTHIAFHYPYVFGGAFHKKYDEIHWSENQKHFHTWCTGQTGFPIVDAGMRQLNTTGYMHNRVRMITASFLIKDLHVDWRWGEKYFAQQLVDYDPSVNNGNWQWVASTGCDAQPYFRVFNPWLQQKKFDKDCVYIKKWVPELMDVAPEVIHAPEGDRTLGYPQPMIDHDIESKKAKMMYKYLITHRGE